MAENTDTKTMGPGPVDKSGPADIGAVTQRGIGTAMAPSGAIMEPDAARSVDPAHPAVDNNPRAGTTVHQNQLDMNDPRQDQHDAVAKALDIEQPRPGDPLPKVAAKS